MVAILPGWQQAYTPYASAHTRPAHPPSAQLQPMQLLGSGRADRFHVSPDAYDRYDAFRQIENAALDIMGATGKRYKTLEEVAGDLRQNLIDFDNQITPVFAEAGISTSPPLTLQGDGKGSVNVVGTHPHQAAVARVFSGENVLVSRFMVAAARNAMVTAGKDPAFQAAYAVDPQRAIRDNIDDLKRKLLGFQMTFGEDGLTTRIV